MEKELKATQCRFLKVGGGEAETFFRWQRISMGGGVLCHEKLALIECEHRAAGSEGGKHEFAQAAAALFIFSQTAQVLNTADK